MSDNEDFGLYDEDIDEVVDFGEEDEVPMQDDDEDNEDNAVGDEEQDEDKDPISDDADLTFTGHTGAVYVCAMFGDLAVSGGGDDKAFVWDMNTGEILLECAGHKDSVTCAGFSHDGKYVATADMAGLIKVWKTPGPGGVDTAPVWTTETTDTVWLQWHHSSHVLLAGTADGNMWMWRVPTGECRMYAGPGVQTESGKLFPDGLRAVAGYGDGSLGIWDLKSNNARRITGANAHTGSVVALDCHRDNVIVMSGSVDGTAKLINSTQGTVLITFQCNPEAPSEEGPATVEAVGFSPTLALAATGTGSGQLDIWDLPTQIRKNSSPQEAGISRLVWDHTSPTLYTAGLDGVVRLWDARTGKQEHKWKGHSNDILDLALSGDGLTLLTGSDDNTCRVFRFSEPER